MMCMLATTYSESVISIPMCEISEPIGPMLNGITYMVLPFMHPSSSLLSVCFISFGSTQLLVGPASSFLRLQMYVRSSTRATSLGSEKQAKLLGLFDSLSLMNVPFSTSSLHISSYSFRDPSHQYT